KAMYHFGDRSFYAGARAESDTAIDLFKKAIELDVNYALAHAQLGYAYAWTAVFIEVNPALIERAKQELGMAERLDPQLAEVHVARSCIFYSQYQDWQVEAAIRELRLAQQLDPSIGHNELSNLYFHIGLDEQWEKEAELALARDPTSETIKHNYVNKYFISCRLDEGRAAHQRIFNRDMDEENRMW